MRLVLLASIYSAWAVYELTLVVLTLRYISKVTKGVGLFKAAHTLEVQFAKSIGTYFAGDLVLKLMIIYGLYGSFINEDHGWVFRSPYLVMAAIVAMAGASCLCRVLILPLDVPRWHILVPTLGALLAAIFTATLGSS